jgi:hypothetical protein
MKTEETLIVFDFVDRRGISCNFSMCSIVMVGGKLSGVIPISKTRAKIIFGRRPQIGDRYLETITRKAMDR